VSTAHSRANAHTHVLVSKMRIDITAVPLQIYLLQATFPVIVLTHSLVANRFVQRLSHSEFEHLQSMCNDIVALAPSVALWASVPPACLVHLLETRGIAVIFAVGPAEAEQVALVTGAQLVTFQPASCYSLVVSCEPRKSIVSLNHVPRHDRAHSECYTGDGPRTACVGNQARTCFGGYCTRSGMPRLLKPTSADLLLPGGA
jgi:hypothetical protein